jgi:hypothetical protein
MKNNAKKSIKIGRINIPLNYWTGLAVYAVILLILAICMIVYTGSCLKKYENSQSDKVMNDFLNDFTKMAADKTLADNIELPASSEFEGKDTFVNMYMSELDGILILPIFIDFLALFFISIQFSFQLLRHYNKCCWQLP